MASTTGVGAEGQQSGVAAGDGRVYRADVVGLRRRFIGAVSGTATAGRIPRHQRRHIQHGRQPLPQLAELLHGAAATARRGTKLGVVGVMNVMEPAQQRLQPVQHVLLVSG